MGARENITKGSASSGADFLQLSGVSKSFGAFLALDDVSFSINKGEFICFLGPSGCGKTTLLRCIAGLETQSQGAIHMGGKDISWLPPSMRDFGIVFQSYALFPNLTAAANVSYGLTNMKMPKVERDTRVTELLSLVGLNQHADKFPSQLSGGEQQRIALVRALATSPRLLLLDEPLSALDAKVRTHLRREIRSIQDRLGVTTIMVTHDQEEAQTMADRIFVMNAGRIEQIGTPDEIYEQPASPFVADFIGVMNFFPGTVLDKNTVACGDYKFECFVNDYETGTKISCAIRPEEITLSDHVQVGNNIVSATITDIEHLGSFLRLYLSNSSLTDTELKIDIRKDLSSKQSIAKGEKIHFNIQKQSIRIYDAKSGV